MIKYRVFSLGNAFDRTKPRKVYAKCAPEEVLSHKDFVKEVAEYSRFFPHSMIEAVLTDVFKCLSTHLTKGDRVTLDGFGTFSVTLKCEGASSEASFSKKNIKGVHVVFTPCRELKETFADVEYKMTPRIP